MSASDFGRHRTRKGRRDAADDPPNKLQFRLITSLVDPDLYPAEELINIYHQRWEIEIGIDEIDTHQRLTWTPFRSQKPVGVVQEFYATSQFYQHSPIDPTCVACDPAPLGDTPNAAHGTVPSMARLFPSASTR